MIRDYARRLYRTLIPFLYARRQFKLFLKASLSDIELRMFALASSTDYFSNFVQPIRIQAPFGNSMLVIAPHQDDEAIGCGGALALQARSGKNAAVVLLQDGGDEHESLGITRAAMTERRNNESRRCAEVAGIEPPLFLNHLNLAAEQAAATDEIEKIIRERKADCVFVPFVLDGHPDHRIANYIAAGALRRIPWSVRVFGYEVWGLCVPNVLLAIDDAIEDKVRMLTCFEIANRAIDYVSSTKGLNMYHSRMFGAGECAYAERFFEVPKNEYIELVERCRKAER